MERDSWGRWIEREDHRTQEELDKMKELQDKFIKSGKVKIYNSGNVEDFKYNEKDK